jgi:hypothetical protein
VASLGEQAGGGGAGGSGADHEGVDGEVLRHGRAKSGVRY